MTLRRRTLTGRLNMATRAQEGASTIEGLRFRSRAGVSVSSFFAVEEVDPDG